MAGRQETRRAGVCSSAEGTDRALHLQFETRENAGEERDRRDAGVRVATDFSRVVLLRFRVYGRKVSMAARREEVAAGGSTPGPAVAARAGSPAGRAATSRTARVPRRRVHPARWTSLTPQAKRTTRQSESSSSTSRLCARACAGRSRLVGRRGPPPTRDGGQRWSGQRRLFRRSS